MDTNDSVGKVLDAVRAARTGKQRIKGVADKGDVGDALDEAALTGSVWLEGRLSTTVVRAPLRSNIETREPV